MKLRNALFMLSVLGLSFTLAAGQQTEGASANSQPLVRTTVPPGAAPHAAPEDKLAPALRILFTGYLLGYYRLPQWQHADFEKDVFSEDGQLKQPSCPDVETDNVRWREELKLPASDPTTTPALQLKQQIDKVQSGYILVGMGDNFGVTLESRAWRSHPNGDSSKPWDLHAKSRTLDGWPRNGGQSNNNDKSQIGDNVGCFLSRAGYTAIVPGENDFYFGPERLQRIAERLANVPEPPPNPSVPPDPSEPLLHKVRMLAANLIVKTEPLEKPEHPIPDSDKLLKFLPGMPNGVESLDVSDKGTLLPYLRQVRFRIAPKSRYSATPGKPGTLHPFLCEIRNIVPNQFVLDDSTEKLEGLDQLEPHRNDDGSADTARCTRNDLTQDWPLVDPSKAATLQPKPPQTQTEKDGSTTMYFNLPAKFVSTLPALFGLCVDRAPDEVAPLNKKLINPPASKNPKPEDFYCLRFTIARPLFWESPPALVSDQGNKKSQPARQKTKQKEQPMEEKETNYPYVVKDLPNGHAVIFGVVDQDITAHVGRDNLSWRNKLKGMKPNAEENYKAKPGKETYGTTVTGVSPTTALVAAMRHFDLVGRQRIKDEKPIYRVLLAQMDRGKAETLGSQLAGTKFGCTDLHFDVIISAAAEGSAATAREDVTFRPNLKLEEKKKKTRDGKPAPPEPPTDPCDIEAKAHTTPGTPSFRQFVVVPFRGYDNSIHKLLNPLRELVLDDCPTNLREFTVDFDKGPPCQADASKLKADSAKIREFETNEDNNTKIQDNYNGMGNSYLAGKGYWPIELSKNKNASAASAGSASKNGNSVVVKNAFQIATLAILREFTKADIAMLQKHDFYFGPFPDPINQASDPAHPSGELLERILWMGDYLQVLTVKGDTLKKVLDESDKFDALDEAAAIEGMETERGLLAFGLQKTRDEQYLVDGMQLDPKRLYTIATSNHIASGDTGYPELADPAFADPQLPAPDKDDHDADDHNPRISTLVCQQLGGSSCVANPGLLFADASQLDRPSQLKPNLVARAHAYSRNFIGSPRRLYDGNSLIDYQAQLEPTWRFSVKDLTVNFSAVRNNLSEVNRATKLNGVQEPGAGNPKAHSADVETHVELVRNKPRWDEYVRGSFLFKVSTADKTAPVSITTGPTAPGTETVPALRLFQFVKNQAATDAGFFWHRKHKYNNRIGLVLEPFHWETQIEKQPLLVNTLYGTNGMASAPAIIKNLPRVYRFLGRIGFRAEGDKNYFEFGYEAGRELNGLKSIGTCNPIATIALTTCLQGLQSAPNFSLASLPIATQQRERNGIYGNLDWTTPLFWKLSLHSQDSLEFFGPAHLDNSTDTKYRNDATETLAMQVWPNLTIGPSLERFDYENKVNFVHFRTWTPGINLTYSFDVYRGGSWLKALRYGPNASGAGK